MVHAKFCKLQHQRVLDLMEKWRCRELSKHLRCIGRDDGGNARQILFAIGIPADRVNIKRLSAP